MKTNWISPHDPHKKILFFYVTIISFYSLQARSILAKLQSHF